MVMPQGRQKNSRHHHISPTQLALKGVFHVKFSMASFTFVLIPFDMTLKGFYLFFLFS